MIRRLPLPVEHIIPKIHGGSDEIDNPALACIDCNLHKGTNLAGIDPETRFRLLRRLMLRTLTLSLSQRDRE